jgi:uncharacterized protein YjaZ
MTVALAILNASGRLSSLRTQIESVYASGLARIANLMPVETIDVVVLAGKNVLPEIGLVGYALGPDVAHITIDPDSPALGRNFDIEFTATLGHELHHCLRMRGPGYGRTLREALISEGMACHFETELRGGGVPFYCSGLDEKALGLLLSQATPELDCAVYDHAGWYFGAARKGLPRHAGYCLGYHVVDRYVATMGVPASRLFDKKAETLFEGA